MIITIDGPIATGKSSIAKHLANKLGFIYFDTGAMYRCLTYGIIKKGIKFHNQSHLKAFLNEFDFEIKIHYGEKCYVVFGEDVTEKIRGPEVTGLVSEVSAIKEVREKLVFLQQHLSKGVNAVFEGRDMGTVVFPDADVKIFLSGSLDVRAQRRFDELRSRFPADTVNLTLEQVKQEISQRDHYDSTREISPLQQAPDAYLVDTTDLTIEEVVFKILEIIDMLPTQ